MVVRAGFNGADVVDRGIQGGQEEWVPVNDRQIIRHLGVHRRFHRAAVEADRHRRFLYSDRLRHCAELQCGIDGDVIPGLDADVALHERTKTFALHREGVDSGTDEVKKVLSRLVRLAGYLHACVVVSENVAARVDSEP